MAAPALATVARKVGGAIAKQVQRGAADQAKGSVRDAL